MKTTKLLMCTVAVAAAFAAVHAKGQNLSATLIEITPGLAVTGTTSGDSNIQTYPAGVLHFTQFDAFCVEPSQDLSYGQTLVYEIQDPSSLANSNTIARLIGGYLASGRTGQDAAAVQWAIWETTSELSVSKSLYDGNVKVITPASEATAILGNQYLSQASSYTPVALTYLTNSNHQDVVTWSCVPEPATAGLAALSGILLLRRRRG